MANEQNRRWTEEIEVAGKELLKRVQDLIKEGNVSRLILKTEKGKTFLEIPVSAGAIIGGVVTLFAPVVTVIGAVGGMMAKVKVEIVRKDVKETENSEQKADDSESSEQQEDLQEQNNEEETSGQ